MKSCRTCPWLCCCIAFFCKLQQNTLLEPSSQRARVSHVPLELLARRATELKAMREWLEEMKFYIFAINQWTKHPFKYCPGVLMLSHLICRYRAVPCSFSAVPGLKAGLNPAQPFDSVGMLFMPKKREQTLFSERFPRLCWLHLFQASLFAASFPPASSEGPRFMMSVKQPGYFPFFGLWLQLCPVCCPGA